MDAHEEPKFTNLYVKNLGENVREDVLRDKFSEFGKVGSVLIMKDTEGKSRGFGFVNFESHEEAKNAMEALNGALLGSEKLFVGKAQKKAEREELLKRKYMEIISSHQEKSKASNLYVKNLHASIDDRTLEEHFRAFGKVTSVKVMRCGNGISKGFGFVCFSTPEEAKRALDMLHGTILKGKSLYVAKAQRKEERCRKLQNYYAQYPLQSFYCSNSDFLTPQFNTTYYSFFPPFPSLDPVSSYTNSCQPMMYQQLGRSEVALYPFMAPGYQRNDSTYQLQIPTRKSQQGTDMDCFNKHPGFASKITGVSLEMNSSDVMKLLKSPKSLAVQVEKAVQVLKDAKSRTVADGGHVAQPAKSAYCLSY